MKAANNLEEINRLESDLKRFQNRSYVQRELLHAIVNKIMYSILLEQERALIQVGFPQFTSDVVAKLESCLNYSKQLISSNANQNVFDHEPQLERAILRQRVFVCALLSVRLNYLNNSELNRRLDVDIGDLKRMSSVESDISGDWAFGDDQRDRRNKKRQATERSNASSGYTIAPTLAGFSSVQRMPPQHAAHLPIQPQQLSYPILPAVSSTLSMKPSWTSGRPRKAESPQPYNPLFPYASGGRGQSRPVTTHQRPSTSISNNDLAPGQSSISNEIDTSTGNLNKLSSMIRNMNKNR